MESWASMASLMKRCGVWDDVGLGGWETLLRMWVGLDRIERAGCWGRKWTSGRGKRKRMVMDKA